MASALKRRAVEASYALDMVFAELEEDVKISLDAKRARYCKEENDEVKEFDSENPEIPENPQESEPEDDESASDYKPFDVPVGTADHEAPTQDQPRVARSLPRSLHLALAPPTCPARLSEGGPGVRMGCGIRKASLHRGWHAKDTDPGTRIHTLLAQ